MEKLKEILLEKSNFYVFEDYDEEIDSKVYQYLITGEIFKINYQTSYYSLIKEEINKNTVLMNTYFILLTFKRSQYLYYVCCILLNVLQKLIGKKKLN
jgi:hypothetical protein